MFISHAVSDRNFAILLAETLKTCQIASWYSEKHIIAARHWHDEIGRALARCDWLIVVLTPASVRSVWVKHELLYALNKKRYQGRIIPLLLKTCRMEKLSWTLPNLQHVDFRKNREAGFRRLFQIWKLRYQATKSTGA